MSFFSVRRVEVVGARYLTPAGITRALAVPKGSSLFDDLDPLLRRARQVPGVLEVSISRRLPGTLRVTVREAVPVALAERSGRLVLVDQSGSVLPFDPTHPAEDLPLAAEPDSAVAGLLARMRESEPDLFARVERSRSPAPRRGARSRHRPAVVQGRRVERRHPQPPAGGRLPEPQRHQLARARRPVRVARHRPGGRRMSDQPQRLVAAVDLGTTRVVGLIGEVTGDAREPRVRVLGAATERTAGVRRGVVRDIEETTRAVAKAMKDAQKMAGVEVGTVYCGVAGEHISARNSHGVVSVTGSEIRTTDVARVNDVASNISFGRDHELLHAIPQDYLIDQQEGITEPIGMTGSRLEAEVYLVTVLSSAVQNLRKCVEKAGYRVGEFVLEPLAASLAVLTPDERELGCAIVELGGGSTNVSIFHAGKIRHTASSMFAGGHVTSDLVAGLQVTQLDAERIKERFGAAYEPMVPETDVFQLPGTAGAGRPHRASTGARAHHAYAAAGSCSSWRWMRFPGRATASGSPRASS